MHNVNQSEQIKCPNCGNFMDISEVLYAQISNKVQEEFQKQKQEFQNEVNKQRIEHIKVLNDLKIQKADQEKLINEKVSQELLLQKQKIQQDFLIQKQNFQKEFSEKFRKEHESEVKIMQDELDQKSKELTQLLSLKAENEKLKREQKENEERLRFQIKEEALKEFKEQENKNLELQKQKIRLEYEEKEMAYKELQIQFNTLKEELDVLKRKADQGSQQLQGEAAELLIQEYIQKEYLSDEVKEVPKGISGADCLHVVKDNFGNICGSILYEIKRTKEFNKEWLDKLKLDSIAAKSDIAVLITKTMPKEREKTHFKEGILVCTFFEFKGVLAVLRESIMNIYKLKNALKNKDEKNHILYEYLNSKEFNTQITFILKTYQNMKEELEAEKRALQNIWKKREKAIENLSFNSTAIVSSLNAIFSDLKGENLIGEDGLKSLENLAKED